MRIQLPSNFLALLLGALGILSPNLNCAWGAPVDFRPVATSEQKTAGIHFKIPYTLGTHDGDALALLGSVKIDVNHPESAQGVLHVPIASIKTGNDSRDCHLRESLGMNYADTGYPKEHVCNDSNQLPGSGKGAVVYPEIELRISSLRSLDPSGRILAERETRIEVEGVWTIHGVARPARFAATVTPGAGRFRLRGEAPISLQAHGIQVKTARIVFAEISVSDEARVAFDIVMEPAAEAAKK